MVHLPLLAIVFTILNWHLTGKVIDQVNVLIIAGLGVWLGLELLRLKPANDHYCRLFKLLTLIFVISMTIIDPVWFAIVDRNYSHDITQVHDGLVQLEIATEGLKRGENPYTLDYFQTRLKDWPYWGPTDINPALYHFAYLPSLVVFNLVTTQFTKPLLGTADARVLFTLAYLGSLVVGFALAANKNNQLAFLVLFGLNPLTLHFLINGRNDIFPLFWILLSILLIEKNHDNLSSLALVVAATGKQSTWPAVPFFLAYWLLKKPQRSLRSRLTPIFLLIVGTLVFFLPFLVTSPAVFLQSTIGYPLGFGKNAYPISPWSLGMQRLFLNTQFPNILKMIVFSFIRFLIPVVVLGYLLRRQQLNNTPANVLVNSGLFLFVFWYLITTYFFDNHVFFIVWLITAAWVTEAGLPKD